jgi:outer membrane protein insertion porin family
MRLRLVIVLIGLVVFSGFAQESDEWYLGKPIKDIVFVGLRHVNQSELSGIIESYKGKLFTDDVFWELQGQLYALEYFESINPNAIPSDSAGTEVIIRFVVTERPMVSRINFSGNTHIRRSTLLEAISIKPNEVVNQLKLRNDERVIIDKYHEKGYPDVTVRSQTQLGKNESVIITFIVDEGEQVIIDALIFEGNSIFSTRTLRGQLSLKPKGLLNEGAFQEEKLIADRNAIMQYYHDRGYIDADVIDVVQEVQKDAKGKNKMTITFRIDEGRQYTFQGFEFEGNKLFPTAQLAAQVYSKKGAVVNARQVEADWQRVLNVYLGQGYIFNTINREEVKNADTGTVSYTVSIVERGRAHIENILVKGNQKTKSNVILRELDLEPGDVFSKTKIENGLRNLYNLQFFSSVVPDTTPGSTDSLMDLSITVEEQPTMDIQAGVTFSGTTDPDQWPISLMAKWNDRNFFGTGDAFSIGANYAYDTQSGTAEYTHRRLFGLPLSVGFDLTLQHSTRYTAMDNMAPFFNGDEDGIAYPDGFDSYADYYKNVIPNEFRMQYDQWRLSLGISTGYRFSLTPGNLGLGIGFRTGFVINSYDADMYRPFDPVIRNRNNEVTPVNSVWTSISLDDRDIYYDPSRGYYGIQRFGYYGIFPVELEHYIRTDTKLEFFHTLLNIPVGEKWAFRLVFGIHSGLSFIFPQPFRDKPEIEKANKLAVDGMFTGRGWTSAYNDKGYALWENWAEIRWPIVPGILAWDFFFDAAAVGKEKDRAEQFFQNLELADMRFSYGGGLRFSIPQFPLRLSLAKRFTVDNDGTVHWQKGIIGDADFASVDIVLSFALSTY